MSLIKLKPLMNFCLNNVLRRAYATNLTRSSLPSTSATNIINSFYLTTSGDTTKIEYKCPSIKTFKIPLNDLQITDVLKRHELKLPQIKNQVELIDPIFQIEKTLPESKINNNVKYECAKPLMSVLKYRRRRMNKKKKKDYMKEQKFVLAKRKVKKEKRFEQVVGLLQKIFDSRTEVFNPIRLVYRELEKAKFYGYKVSDDYDKYRNYINNINTFDEKYFRTFPNLIQNADTDRGPVATAKYQRSVKPLLKPEDVQAKPTKDSN